MKDERIARGVKVSLSGAKAQREIEWICSVLHSSLIISYGLCMLSIVRIWIGNSMEGILTKQHKKLRKRSHRAE